MVIEGLLALEQLSVSDANTTIEGEVKKAQVCARTGVPKLPGIPDIPDMINAWMISNWEGLKIEIITECEEFLAEFESDTNGRIVTKVNKFIKKLNDFVKKLNKLIEAIVALIAPICPIITAISIIMIVAKVITLIPSFGGGFGAVVVATSPQAIAQSIYTFAVDVLNKINKVPFALVGVLNMIVAIYEYIEIVYHRIVISLKRQQALLARITEALLRTADDWLDIDYDRKAEADARLKEAEKNLKKWETFNNDMMQLGKDFKDALNDISTRLGLQMQINNLEKLFDLDDGYSVDPTPPPLPEEKVVREECSVDTPPLDALWERYPENYIDECGDTWVCQDHPDPEITCDWEKDGTNIFDGVDTTPVVDTTPDVSAPYCDEFGNCWEYDLDTASWKLIITEPISADVPLGEGDLESLRLGLLDELDNLGGPVTGNDLLELDEHDRLAVQNLLNSLGNTVISSLLHPHGDVTIQKATAKTGKRYGFYQSDI